MAKKLDFSKASYSTDMSKMQNKSKESANAKTSIDLDITLIDENPDNSSVFNMDEVPLLAKTIKEQGFYGAIEVFRKKDGRYEITSGHRRFGAAKLLGFKTIPTIVEGEPDYISKRKKLILSNVNNRKMTPIDWMHSVAYQRDTHILEEADKLNINVDLKDENVCKQLGLSEKDILCMVAEDFGITYSVVWRYMSLYKLIPSNLELLKNGNISVSSAAQIASEDEELQARVYSVIKADLDYYKNTSNEDDMLPRLESKAFIENAIRSERIKRQNEIIREDEEKYRKRMATTPTPKKIENVYHLNSNESLEDLPKKNNNSEAISLDSVIKIKNNYEKPEFRTSDKPLAPEVNKIVIKKNSIDNTIKAYSNQLNSLVSDDFEISDIDSVREYIESIKNAITEIEKKLV